MRRRIERRIVQKAEYVAEALEILASKRESLTFEEYAAQREQRDVVEREFQTTIEACIDIGELLLQIRKARLRRRTLPSSAHSASEDYSATNWPIAWPRPPDFATFSHTDTATRSTTRTFSTSCSTICRSSASSCKKSGQRSIEEYIRPRRDAVVSTIDEPACVAQS